MTDKPLHWMGVVKRWKVGNVYFAKNDFVLLAWAITDNPAKVGELAVVEGIIIQWFTAEKAKLWDGCGDKEPE